MPHTFRNLTCALLAFAWPVAASFGQSPASSFQQTPAPEKQDSVAEAARKAKEKKAASSRKVFTEDDISGMKKEGVSVVGTENQKRPESTPASKENGEDPPNSEKYWRGEAQPILEKIADIDKEIAPIKEDLKKYGIGGFDVATGFRNNVAYVEDRNAQIQELQKKKANLQKKLEDLQEEGRKAGAEPSWFR